MAGPSIEFRRLLLRGIGWDAPKKGMTLREALQGACQARLDENQTGLTIAATSGNGASVTFSLPQSASSLSPEAVLAAVSRLYDLYEESVAELGTDEATATDAAILARMLLLLTSRNEVYTDRSGVCV